ncbi:hypothetical protein QP866_10290, partial [Corynebacterium imitans]|uniref:hypothetical protein n=1 Tax=Corynebacterium imitans TaxID=156978 RepID=UPI00254F234C
NKCFSKKQGREKPENLTKNKPTHTTRSNAGLANPQITALTSSHPTRENRNQPNKNKVTK